MSAFAFPLAQFDPLRKEATACHRRRTEEAHEGFGGLKKGLRNCLLLLLIPTTLPPHYGARAKKRQPLVRKRELTGLSPPPPLWLAYIVVYVRHPGEIWPGVTTTISSSSSFRRRRGGKASSSSSPVDCFCTTAWMEIEARSIFVRYIYWLRFRSLNVPFPPLLFVIIVFLSSISIPAHRRMYSAFVPPLLPCLLPDTQNGCVRKIAKVRSPLQYANVVSPPDPGPIVAGELGFFGIRHLFSPEKRRSRRKGGL